MAAERRPFYSAGDWSRLCRVKYRLLLILLGAAALGLVAALVNQHHYPRPCLREVLSTLLKHHY